VPGRYSCAGICTSASRQALNFKRRHTQHSPSVELGAHSPPQITHAWGFLKRSDSIVRRARSRITSGTMASEVAAASGRGRFRLTVFTIPQAHRASSVRVPRVPRCVAILDQGMTKVTLHYDLLRPLRDNDLEQVDNVRGTYGIARLQVSPGRDRLTVDYDASRLMKQDVEAELRRHGLPLK
jgi:hypothetical protein